MKAGKINNIMSVCKKILNKIVKSKGLLKMEKYRHKVTVDEENRGHTFKNIWGNINFRFASEAIINICEKYKKVQGARMVIEIYF